MKTHASTFPVERENRIRVRRLASKLGEEFGLRLRIRKRECEFPYVITFRNGNAQAYRSAFVTLVELLRISAQFSSDPDGNRQFTFRK